MKRFLDNQGHFDYNRDSEEPVLVTLTAEDFTKSSRA